MGGIIISLRTLYLNIFTNFLILCQHYLMCFSSCLFTNYLLCIQVDRFLYKRILVLNEWISVQNEKWRHLANSFYIALGTFLLGCNFHFITCECEVQVTLYNIWYWTFKQEIWNRLNKLLYSNYFLVNFKTLIVELRKLAIFFT